VDDDASNAFFWTVNSYTTPSTLSLADASEGPAGLALKSASASGSGPGARVLRSLPPFFNASGLVVSQGFASSKDGTMVPYFLIRSRAAPGDGCSGGGGGGEGVATTAKPPPAPTLLYGYGGFRISMTPGYAATIGAGWLERGGTYVVANIRGGGEFGPAWHAAALKDKRHKVRLRLGTHAALLSRLSAATPFPGGCL